MSPSPSVRSRDHLHPTSALLAHCWYTAHPRRCRTLDPQHCPGVGAFSTRTRVGSRRSALAPLLARARARTVAPVYTRAITARARAPRFDCTSRAQQAHIHTPTTRGRSPPTVHHRLPGSPIPITTPRTRARCSSDLARIRASTQQPRLHRHRPCSPPPVLVPMLTSTRRRRRS
jgi:hypothetical protein